MIGYIHKEGGCLSILGHKVLKLTLFKQGIDPTQTPPYLGGKISYTFLFQFLP